MRSNALETFSLASLNCRGLGDKTKRLTLFNWLKTKYKGLVLLQETHSTELYENQWEKEWGNKIFFSHGQSNSRGVAILSPINSDITLTNITKDTDGRILLIDYTVHETKFTVINVYAPTKDKVSLQNEFLENIRVMVENNGDKNIVVEEDFNTCLNPEFDKKG